LRLTCQDRVEEDEFLKEEGEGREEGAEVRSGG
jgi:hypothetical protein